MSKVTVREAAQLAGKTRETINAATNDGTLSYSLNGRKHKVIDVAELERVYPLVKNMDQIKAESSRVSKSPTASDSDVKTELAVLKQKLANSDAMHETIQTERSRERRQLESEIDNLRANLEKSQEQHSKALLLITDQSKNAKQRTGDWEATARGLKEQIANQETLLEKRLLGFRQDAKRETIEEIKNKYWWQVVFGS